MLQHYLQPKKTNKINNQSKPIYKLRNYQQLQNDIMDQQQVKPTELAKRKNDDSSKPKKNGLRRKYLLIACPLRRLNLKHIVNVNDTWFVNEESLKNSENSEENIQRAMFRYKMISKIILNSSFVGLQLKKVDDNYLPPEYFFQRFRSLGDRQIATIANDLQSIYNIFNQLKGKDNPNEVGTTSQQALRLLNQFLKEMEGKMYTIYYIQITKSSVNLKNLFFSIPLLHKLGWNIKRVATDFLKYRHVFFEIFSPKYYKEFIRICINNYMKAQQIYKDQTLTREQKIEMTTIYFDDEVVRQVDTEHGIYEEFLKAKVKFSCPHASFCCVEILEIDEDRVERVLKKRKYTDDFIEISPLDEISQLKKLGFESSFLQLDYKQQQIKN